LDVDTYTSGDGMDVDQLLTLQRAKNFDAVRKHVKELVREGYSAAQILSQVIV
jgi:hypothetical protein